MKTSMCLLSCIIILKCQIPPKISIGLFYDSKVTDVIVSVKGAYELIIDNVPYYLGTGDGFRIYTRNGKAFVNIITKNTRIEGLTFMLVSKQEGSSIMVQVQNPPRKRIYKYTGDVSFRFNGYFFQMVNTTDIDDYIAGVIEAEVGRGKSLEFYKAKAVLARTYAIYSIKRHEIESFNLCDGVHCQVYYGLAGDPSIIRAVEATHGEVLVDDNGKIAFAPFHSNCGGETSFSDVAWSYYIPYLVPVIDTFCRGGEHATWRRSIPLTKYKEFLATMYPGRSVDSMFYLSIQQNSIARSRKKNFIEEDTFVRTVDARNYFSLPSSFFRIEYNGDGVVTFVGRGFGHGVGFCQEGAMQQAQMGKSYTEILMFYFPLLRINKMPVFSIGK